MTLSPDDDPMDYLTEGLRGGDANIKVGSHVMCQGAQPGVVAVIGEPNDASVIQVGVVLDAVPQLGTQPFVLADLELIP